MQPNKQLGFKLTMANMKQLAKTQEINIQQHCKPNLTVVPFLSFSACQANHNMTQILYQVTVSNIQTAGFVSVGTNANPLSRVKPMVIF